MKKTLWILFITFFLALGTCSSAEGAEGEGSVNIERCFHLGNDYYEKGEYEKALSEYNKIFQSGYESKSLYYNTANAYFKSGQLGKALVNYERAVRLAPRDSDLISNYKFARSNVASMLQIKRDIWLLRIVKAYGEKVTLNELIWFSSFIYVIIIILLFTAVLRPDAFRRILPINLALLAALILNLCVISIKVYNTGKEGVIITQQVESRYGPFDSATVFFKLHEGMKVKILDYKEGWVKVKRADGKIGWISKSDVEVI